MAGQIKGRKRLAAVQTVKASPGNEPLTIVLSESIRLESAQVRNSNRFQQHIERCGLAMSQAKACKGPTKQEEEIVFLHSSRSGPRN